MPIYIYKAKKDNAESVVGEVDAQNADAAIEMVARQGLVPVSVEEKLLDSAGRSFRPGPVRLKVLYGFTRQLANLLKSGVPLLQAIEILAKQNRNTYFARVLYDVHANVQNGRSFSASLFDHSETFSDLFVAMAHAGEESGKLPELLTSLARYYRKQDEILTRIRGALVYPVFMLVVGILTVIFILTYVMPRITVLFESMKTALPWPTLVVMGASRVVSKGWPALAVVALALSVLFRSVNVTRFLTKISGRALAGLPFLNDIMIKIDVERLSRTMSLLLHSGIPILRALEITIPTLGQEGIKKELWVCQNKITGGMGFGEALREASALPDVFAQLVTVGEESGELSEAMADIAESYEQEINEFTRSFSNLLEPVMILLVGLVVGFIVFAMLMPVFQMDIFAK
jgi:type II secretory pathway component PulF